MEEKTTNLDRLIFGVKHLAGNRNLNCDTDYKKNGGYLIIYGSSIPLYSDFQMLCDDCEATGENIADNGFTTSIRLSDEWLNTTANKPYSFSSYEFWRKLSQEEIMKMMSE